MRIPPSSQYPSLRRWITSPRDGAINRSTTRANPIFSQLPSAMIESQLSSRDCRICLKTNLTWSYTPIAEQLLAYRHQPRPFPIGKRGVACNTTLPGTAQTKPQHSYLNCEGCMPRCAPTFLEVRM